MPANGGYKCSDGSYFNSRCEFFCSPGFSLKGQKTTTCQHNKRWSVEVPTCVGKTTKGLEKCLHVVVFEKSIDSHRYKCTPSSVLQSSWSNLYLNEGRWEHDFSSPSYKKKTCFIYALNVLQFIFWLIAEQLDRLCCINASWMVLQPW